MNALAPTLRRLTAEESFRFQADDLLAEFYRAAHATTTPQKIRALEDFMGGPGNIYCTGIQGESYEVTEEMKLRVLESSYLVDVRPDMFQFC